MPVLLNGGLQLRGGIRLGTEGSSCCCNDGGDCSCIYLFEVFLFYNKGTGEYIGNSGVVGLINDCVSNDTLRDEWYFVEGTDFPSDPDVYQCTYRIRVTIGTCNCADGAGCEDEQPANPALMSPIPPTCEP